MKVKFIKAGRADGVAHKKGEVVTLPDRIAEKLLSRGYVTEWTAATRKEEADGAASGE